jgi:hypothetical protein
MQALSPHKLHISDEDYLFSDFLPQEQLGPSRTMIIALHVVILAHAARRGNAATFFPAVMHD